MQILREALRSRDRQKIHSAAETLDKTLHKLTPVTWESHWRENCEVIFGCDRDRVGIRSYFPQPFKIPTGSMQPTLNGIIGHPSTGAAAKYSANRSSNSLFWVAIHNVVSREDDQIFEIVPKKVAFFLLFRDWCVSGKAFSYTPRPTPSSGFSTSFPVGFFIAAKLSPRRDRHGRPGDLSINCSYNFVKPHNGDVLSSGQMLFRGFAKTRSRARRFTSNGGRSARRPVCASIRRFSTSTAKRPRVTGSRG